jgi:hypothetical protein
VVDDLESEVPAGLVARQAFAACLDKLMTDKVRPSGLQLRWTNESLAEVIGNTPTSISNWRGGILPDPRNFDRLVNAFFGPPPRTLNRDLQDRLNDLVELWKAARRFSLRGKRTLRRSNGLPELYGVPSLLPNFVGREQTLIQIADFFGGQRQRKWLVLTGMPGVGKTALAARYFQQHNISFANVWWCPAETREKLLSSLGELGNVLGVIRSDDATAEAYANLILRTEALQGWCLVYDNVNLLSEIDDLLPAHGTALLMTSRTADWSEWAIDQIVVEELPIDDAVRFLQMQSGQNDLAGANELALAVGCLPLALGHAASTCKQRKMAFANYTAELRKNIATAPVNTRYPTSVFATIKIAIEAIPNGEIAKHLLILLGFCSPDRIPQVLAEVLLANETDEVGSQAILDLITFSLVRSDPYDDGEPALVVHRLVQEVGRAIARSSESAQIVADQLALGLWRLFPVASTDAPETWPYCEKLFPHVMALWNDSELFTEGSELWLELAVSAARFQRVTGHHDSAASMIGFAAQEADRLLPRDSMVRVNALLEYAAIRTSEEDTVQAKAVYEEVLPIIASVKGETHSLVAETLTGLGHILAREHSHGEACNALHRALDIFDEKEASEPYRVSHCLSALGWSQLCSKKFAEAELSLVRAVKLAQQDATRKGQVALVAAYDSLALLHVALENPDLAFDFAGKSIALVFELFGEGRTLSLKIKSLAMICDLQKRYIHAQYNFEIALAMAEQYGPAGHRSQMREEVAEHFMKCGDYFRARDITAAELNDRAEAIGENNRLVFLMRANVARLSLFAGEFVEAYEQSAAVLSNEQILLPENEAALISAAGTCKEALEALGRHDEARAVWQKFNVRDAHSNPVS